MRRFVSRLHHLPQLRDALRGKRFGDLLLCGRGFLAVGCQQPGQQPALEVVQAHRLERLIRRVRRAAAGVVPAVGLDDLGDHRGQPLVDVGQLLVVGEHVDQCLTQRLDVVGRQTVAVRSASVQHGPGAQCGREVQVEQRVVGLAVIRPAQHRARDALPQRRAIAQTEHAHHPAGVHGLRRTHRDPRAAQGFHELHQVTGNPVRRQRLRRAGASGRHQLSLSSPAALI